MPVVNIRQLARSTSQVIGTVARTKRPVLVTRGGRPIAVVSALDAEDLEDWILANAPEFVQSMREADSDIAAGRTISLDDFLAQRTRRSRGRGKPGARRATRKT